MKVKVINKSKHEMPSYATEGSAGLDIRANLKCGYKLKVGERILISTGIHLELPRNYEAQIRPRSGLAFKNGITVLNAPGTIDSDYRGEVKVLLINLSNMDYIIKDGERIAQMVISPVTHVSLEEIDAATVSLSSTSRGSGGLGSTGKD